jgi:hypothetical protein
MINFISLNIKKIYSELVFTMLYYNYIKISNRGVMFKYVLTGITSKKVCICCSNLGRSNESRMGQLEQPDFFPGLGLKNLARIRIRVFLARPDKARKIYGLARMGRGPPASPNKL